MTNFLQKHQNKVSSVVFACGLAILGGCTVVPKPIEVAKNESLIPFEQVSAQTQANQASDQTQALSAQGEKARWGGKIVSVENKKDVSEIEVVFFPENSFGKPRTGEPSVGRFKAVVKGFVDPIVFEQGRLITVVGEVGDIQSGLIGEQSYQYPTLNALGYHMWKQTTDVEVDTFAFAPFGYYAGYNRSFFSPWYDPWHFRSYRQRLRVTHNNGHQQGATLRTRVSPQTPANTARPITRTQNSSSAARSSSMKPAARVKEK